MTFRTETHGQSTKLFGLPIRYFVIIITFICIVSCANWLDVLRDYEDREIQRKIELILAKHEIAFLGKILQNASTICIIPPYGSPPSDYSILTDSQINFLKLRINKLIGKGDHVWWIISIDKDKSITAHRMAGKLRPAFKKTKCKEEKNASISIASKNGYMFFNFIGDI